MKKTLMLIALLGVGLAGCKGKQPATSPAPEPPPASKGAAPPAAKKAPEPAPPPQKGGKPTAEARARAAVANLKGALKSALVKAMADGFDNAITVCKELAPRLAKEAATEGVVLGRTSHKLRNPDNAPRPWVEPLIATYQRDPGTDPRSVKLDGGKVGYVEPIYAGKLCLACHGAGVSPDIKKKLAGLYPDDRATGFAEGQLRGLFWAEVTP